MQQHNYIAKEPDKQGYIAYTDEENATWALLYERQIALIKDRACDEFINGVQTLNLLAKRIPQCKEVSKILGATTGWSVKPVAALISFQEFFELLAAKQFPAASFIRRRDELNYLKEPDIFHELFGHCPMLTDQSFADFTQAVGEFGRRANKADKAMLARLYWFTVEFGLIQTANGLRIYGGGILSSKTETVYALESPVPQRKNFSLLDILRTPYRYDELQKSYFIINSFAEIYNVITKDLLNAFAQARRLGMLPNRHEIEALDVRSC